MAASTVNDDLARELDLLREDNLELRAQVSALVDVITPGPTGGAITALNAGGVVLDNKGLSLPISSFFGDQSGIISWADSTFQKTTAVQHIAGIQGYRGESGTTQFVVTRITAGHDSSLSESPKESWISNVMEAQLSTETTPSSNVYSLHLDMVARDTGINQIVYQLWAGEGDLDEFWDLITVSKLHQGVKGEGDASTLAGTEYAIGLFTGSPSTNASLDIAAQKPVLFPRMTSAQKDAITPQAGMIYYNTESSRLISYSGSGPTSVVLSSG
ncbi:hypothetical protein LCGC14_2269870 [marine sediment metagenome]|uniref:Uncharacterized protein n=1 Tax=marine sediment metagenome TaxID=412755 RepID=A0A0F9CX91_9ZZZZ